MSLDIPPFSTLNYDPDTRKATFSIKDNTVKHQLAMWGMLSQLAHVHPREEASSSNLWGFR